jgi:hypothetical protein
MSNKWGQPDATSPFYKPPKPPPGSVITGYVPIKVGASARSPGRTVHRPIYSSPAPAPAPAPARGPAPKPQPRRPAPQASAPERLSIQQSSPYQSQIDALMRQISQMSTPTPPPEPPRPSVSSSTDVDANAAGFTRAQSAAKKARLTNKGTSRLRISRTGQTSASSGLNIGV